MKNLNNIAKLLVVITVFFLILYLFNDQYTSILSDIINRYGYLAFTISAGLLEGVPQILSTDILLIMGAIFEFNTTYTLISVAVGATIGSIIAYYLGLKYGKKLARYFVSENRYTQIVNYINTKGKYAMPLISISPLPFFPLVFGATKVSLFDFLIYGLTIRIIKHACISLIIFYLVEHNQVDVLQSWFQI